MSSQNNNKNGKNNKPNPRLRGALTLVAWALVLTVVFNYFTAYSSNTANKSTSHEVGYSDFITMVEKNQVDKVLFKDGVIYITPVEGYVFTEEKKDQSTSRVPGKEQTAKTYTHTKETPLTLYTAQLNDPQLLALLKEHKSIEFTGYYQAQMSPILEFMVGYILPTLIMLGLLMLFMRLLSKKGGGIGGRMQGVPREDGFEITVASEIMAILCLSKNIDDLKERVARVTVGYTYDDRPVTVRDLKIQLYSPRAEAG